MSTALNYHTAAEASGHTRRSRLAALGLILIAAATFSFETIAFLMFDLEFFTLLPQYFSFLWITHGSTLTDLLFESLQCVGIVLLVPAHLPQRRVVVYTLRTALLVAAALRMLFTIGWVYANLAAPQFEVELVWIWFIAFAFSKFVLAGWAFFFARYHRCPTLGAVLPFVTLLNVISSFAVLYFAYANPISPLTFGLGIVDFLIILAWCLTLALLAGRLKPAFPTLQ